MAFLNPVFTLFSIPLFVAFSFSSYMLFQFLARFALVRILKSRPDCSREVLVSISKSGSCMDSSVRGFFAVGQFAVRKNVSFG